MRSWCSNKGNVLKGDKNEHTQWSNQDILFTTGTEEIIHQFLANQEQCLLEDKAFITILDVTKL